MEPIRMLVTESAFSALRAGTFCAKHTNRLIWTLGRTMKLQTFVTAVCLITMAGCGKAAKSMPQSTIELKLAPAVERFRNDTGRYPSPDEQLSVLLRAPDGMLELWRGPYISDPQLLLDPWGTPYRFFPHSASSFTITCLGPDRMSSADDISVTTNEN
jgi:hypothetical protein